MQCLFCRKNITFPQYCAALVALKWIVASIFSFNSQKESKKCFYKPSITLKLQESNISAAFPKVALSPKPQKHWCCRFGPVRPSLLCTKNGNLVFNSTEIEQKYWIWQFTCGLKYCSCHYGFPIGQQRQSHERCGANESGDVNSETAVQSS